MAAKTLFAEAGVSECHKREMNPGVYLYKYLTLLPRALTVRRGSAYSCSPYQGEQGGKPSD